jgi:hypothetical protein
LAFLSGDGIDTSEPVAALRCVQTDGMRCSPPRRSMTRGRCPFRVNIARAVGIELQGRRHVMSGSGAWNRSVHLCDFFDALAVPDRTAYFLQVDAGPVTRKNFRT